MSPGPLLIRADASIPIGTGHVMRCLALAQAWQDSGGTAAFAMAESTAAVRERLQSEGMDVVPLASVAGTHDDAQETARIAAQLQAKWIVVDGYRFDAGYQRALTNLGVKILFLDDNGHCDYYTADLVLNQNIYAEAAAYANRTPHTKLLLGLQYALLRREYTRLAGWQPQTGATAHNLLVTMGGSDAVNFSMRVMESLPLVEVEGLDARIAVGGSSPHFESLKERAGRLDGCVELLSDIQNMAELMTWADIVVAAAGTVSWEICALGLPAILIPVADNQINTALALEQQKVARVLQPDCTAQQIAESIRELMLSASSRERLSRNGRALLDMGGSRRVVKAILSSTN